jgi:tRNA nucleotidyltransferase (CCA-adding enzyme)
MGHSPTSLREAFSRQHPQLVEAVQSIVYRVSSIEHTGSIRALIVGGFVRDLLLGLSPTDADIEVYGIEANALEALLNELFPGQVNLVGRSFVVFKIGLGEGYEIDLALPRRESKTGVGHKDFAVEGDPSLDPREASRRRDFTINAISFDPQTGALIDPWNGVQDLEAKILRVVDANHFGEDPLRVYRAVQFAARFELTVETATKARFLVGPVAKAFTSGES